MFISNQEEDPLPSCFISKVTHHNDNNVKTKHINLDNCQHNVENDKIWYNNLVKIKND